MVHCISFLLDQVGDLLITERVPLCRRQWKTEMPEITEKTKYHLKISYKVVEIDSASQ